MKSIMQDEKVCYLTGLEGDGSLYGSLDKHHIYFGSDRKTSERNGFWVWLRHDRHIQDSKYSTPHNDFLIDLTLKIKCQKKFEQTHSRKEFMKLIGKSYL